MDRSGYKTKYSLDFSNSDYQKYFALQYSYTNHSTPDHYFELNTLNGKHVLYIRLYENDQPFEKGSNTGPRSELRETATQLTNGKEYLFEWSYYLNTDTKWNEFHGIINQYFANGYGPCDDITIQKDAYYFEYITNANSDNKETKIVKNPSPSGDARHWIDYFVKYKVSTSSDGYIKWYRGSISHQSNCSLVFGYNGVTARNSGSYNYIKLGMYDHIDDNMYSSLYLTDFLQSNEMHIKQSIVQQN